MTQDPIILRREGRYTGYGTFAWRQYLVVTDRRVAVVHMEQALFGWNIGRVNVQDGDSHGTMTRDQIVAWKMDHDDGLTVDVTHAPYADIDPAFRERLLKAAGVK